MPTVIYSEKCLPQSDNMMNVGYYYVPDTHTMVADEKKIYKDIIENHVFEFFANSFLVECSDDDALGEITFASLSCERAAKYCVGTKFKGTREVVKFPLYQSIGKEHLDQILRNEKSMADSGLTVLRSRKTGGELRMDYVSRPTLENVLLEAYKSGNRDDIYAWFDRLWEEIRKSSPKAPRGDNVLYTLGLGITPDTEKYGDILRVGYLDMLPRNAFVGEGKSICWFDQEWVLENVPAKYVIFRAIVELYFSYGGICGRVIPLAEIAQRYDLVNVWDDMAAMESLFKDLVVDRVLLAEEGGFVGNAAGDCKANIVRLMEAAKPEEKP